VKIVLVLLLGILAMNAVLILGVAVVLIADHIRSRRHAETEDESEGEQT
jgi:hypothetical protein